MKSPPPLFRCPACNECQPLQEASTGGQECGRCRYHCPNAISSVFWEADWESCTDPVVLISCLSILGQEPNQRQLRLIYCGLSRTAFEWCFWFREAAALGEEWADTGNMPPLAPRFARMLSNPRPTRHPGDDDWLDVAFGCVAPHPRLDVAAAHLGGYTLTAAAGILRDLFPNPFRPLAWHPNWVSTAARDLARVMYESRDFSAAPILADALEEAGCAEPAILDHLRGPTEHVRGCWVIDHVLGRA